MFGLNDIATLKLGDGIDSAILQRQALKDGTTFEWVLNEIQNAVNAFNAATDPLIASLCGVTDDLFVQVPQGTLEFSAASEEARPYAQRTSVQGWMLEPVQEDLELRFTWQYLRNATRSRVQEQIQLAIQAARDAIQYHVLRRLMVSAETAVESGYSPGLASGSSLVPYTPPKYMGQTFLSTHSHYNRADGLDDCAAANSADLIEHGFAPPFVHLVSAADLTSWQSETNFIKPQVGPVIPSTAAASVQGTEFEYGPLGLWNIGYCADGYVQPVPRIPSQYTATVKSFGINNPQNVLAVKFSDDLKVPLAVRPDRDLVYDGIYLYLEFWIGVKNPIGGACAYNASSGNYTDPTVNR